MGCALGAFINVISSANKYLARGLFSKFLDSRNVDTSTSPWPSRLLAMVGTGLCSHPTNRPAYTLNAKSRAEKLQITYSGVSPANAKLTVVPVGNLSKRCQPKLLAQSPCQAVSSRSSIFRPGTCI